MPNHTKMMAIANGETLKGHYPEGINWDVDIQEQTLLDVFHESVEKFPDNIFIDFMGKTYTYKEMDELSDKATAGFQEQGIKKGDKIGLFMPNSPYYIIMLYAALKAGAVVVNYDSSYSADQVEQQIKASKTDLMVTMSLENENASFYPSVEKAIKNGVPDNFKVVVCSMAEALPFPKSLIAPLVSKPTKISNDPDIKKHVIEYKDLINNNGWRDHVSVEPNDLAALQYTSGTTKAPKGVMLSHFNLAANVQQVSEFLMAKPDQKNQDKMLQSGKESILGAIPTFHVFGMNILSMFSMKEGSKVLMLPNPRDIKTIARTIDKKRPTMIPLIPRHVRALQDYMTKKPTFFDTLLQVTGIIPKRNIDFSNTKIVMTGGAALDPTLAKEFNAKTGANVIQGYGLSETSPVISFQHPLAKNNDPKSIGLPFPGTEIMIAELDKGDGFTPAKAGETGEICVKGPQVMQGYHNLPEKNASVLKNGWFRTGDVGHINPDTMQSYITDRADDMGKINGEKVSSIFIEEQIAKHPDIAECNTIFINDPSSGQAAVAFIRLNSGAKLEENDIRKFFDNTKMDKLDKPKYIYFWPENGELPKTSALKPDKVTLRKIATELINEGAKENYMLQPKMN